MEVVKRSMERQTSFAQSEYAAKKKQTRRDIFLGEMEKVVPWARLLERIEPHYPKGERGRPPIGLERMLRVYFLQQWYGLADEALEDALYDSQALRTFAGIDLGTAVVPDATTLLKFRRLLETHGLTKEILSTVNAFLQERQLLLRQGTLVDATIIAAPPSTKNQAKARNPDMHQTKKGNQWHFGMKAHIGADLKNGLVHTVVSTAANVSDISQAHALLHGAEQLAFADAGYTGVEKRPEVQAAHPKVVWEVAAKRQSIQRFTGEKVQRALRRLEKYKAGLRAAVEHPFHVLKNLFRHRKTRYRALAKNHAQLETLFALVNLFRVRHHLMAA